MNFDDETYLSAYLDDELDPADRMAIEWSIESSPPLAGRLRALAETRDAVAGLGRPSAPVDLGPILARRLAASPRPIRRRVAAGVGPLMLAGGFGSLAAGLITALVFLHRATHDLRRPDRPEPAPLVAQPIRTPPEPAPSVVGPPLLARLEPARTDPRPQTEPAAPPPAVREALEAPDRERRDRERIAGMLERPDVHRVLIVTDVIDAGERVRALLQRDARKSPDFGRITVTEGIVIDPRHPGAAEVFTLVLDRRECEPLVGKLARAFPKVVVEPRPDPGMLTQVAEVGQAAILPGLSLDSPDLPLVLADNKDEATGLRAAGDTRSGSFLFPEIDQFAATEGFSLFQEPGGEVPQGGPAPYPASSGPTTMVVWVTRPTRH